MTAADIRKELDDLVVNGSKLSSPDLVNTLSLQVIAIMACEIAAQLADMNERATKV